MCDYIHNTYTTSLYKDGECLLRQRGRRKEHGGQWSKEEMEEREVMEISRVLHG